jgi:hypothetical protein
VDKRAYSNSDIETLCDHVKIAIGQNQLDPQIWMSIEEAPDKRNDTDSH